MADKKISELTPLVTPASDDELAIVDKSETETKKITAGNFRNHTPKAHAVSHKEGGGDELPLFQIIFSGISDYGFDNGITKYFWVGRSASDGFIYLCGVMPVAGTLKKLYVRMAWNDCNGSSTLTLYKNEVATDLAITIPAGASYQTISDTEHEVSLAAGDRVAFKIVVGGNAGAIGFAGVSLVFVPD